MNKIFLFLIASMFLFACRKPAAKSTVIDQTIKKDTIVPMDVVCVNNLVYSTFSSKAKVDYNDGQTNVSANLNIRIKKDSLIWLSGTMFGIEGIRAMISKDSVWYINKLEKTYSAYSINDLGKRLNINLSFQIIESILVGNTPLNQRIFDKVNKQETLISLTQNVDEVSIVNLISKLNCKLEKLEVNQHIGFGKAEINYANFNLLNEMLFAYNNSVNINYTDQTGSHKTLMIINHNKVDLNDANLKFPFNIPNRYERK